MNEMTSTETTTEIVRQTAKTITIKLASDFSPDGNVRAGIEKTLRKSSKVYGFAPEVK